MATNKKTEATPKAQPGKAPDGRSSPPRQQAVVSLRPALTMKLAFLLGIISFVVYANTLKNGYAIDDSMMLVNNTIVAKGVAAIPELFSTPHQRGFHEITNDEYRPLPMVLLAIEYQFFEKNFLPYHLMNILLFAGCVVLLFFFLDNLFVRKKTAVAFIAALLFALHPIHTEVVANIKSSDEILCFFFAFLSLNVFIRYIHNGKAALLIAGSFCLFLSYLSKETVVTFLAIIPLVFFFFLNENKKRSLHICAGMVLVTILFLVIRFSILNYYHANNMTLIGGIENALAKQGLTFESRLATAILIMGYYLKLLFVPYPLICDYSYNTIPYVHFSDPLVLISLALYIFPGLLAIIRFVKNHKDPYAFGIAFFLITISLFSNILFLIKATLGERFLFYPSVGFCLIAALLIEKWVGKSDLQLLKHPKTLSLLIPLCIVYLFITIDRNSDWFDDYTLYRTDVKKAPDNCRLNYYAGFQIFGKAKQEPNPAIRTDMLQEATRYFRKALVINPDYYFSAADLGAAYFAENRYDSAEIYDKTALRILPGLLLTRNNLSGVYLHTKQYPADIALCKESIALFPENIYAYADIGVSYMNTGKQDSAIYFLNKGIAIDPGFYGFYAVYADLYHALGNMDSVRKYQYLAQKYSARSN